MINQRNQSIMNRFDGNNYQQLADEFRLTVRQIMHIVHFMSNCK